MNKRVFNDAGESDVMGCLGLIVLVLILVYLGSTTLAGAFYHEHTATCTVTRMDRGGESSAYRIYTAQCGVLANADSLLRGKTDSADVWAQIAVGHTYRFRIVGYRLGLTSDFPNILAIEQEVHRG